MRGSLLRNWTEARTLSIVGMCKNAGKTTVLDALCLALFGRTPIARMTKSAFTVFPLCSFTVTSFPLYSHAATPSPR